MEKKLKFIKMTADGWYVQLPNYEGHVSDLQMVAGADTLCELIANDLTEITVIVSDEPFDLNDFKFSTRQFQLEFINSTGEEGANYRLESLQLDVWLCNVTKYVFGKFPATIYIRV
jgi:hypothetical protein